jgi:NCS1 family nucleobase:cation symporter-1
MAFAPLCGIQIFDYYFLRGRKIDIRAMFVGTPGSAYRFWGGFNPAALIAMAVGCGTYLYLLNPLTYVSHGPYDYTTATLPTVLITGIVHVIATKIIVKPAGKGGY